MTEAEAAAESPVNTCSCSTIDNEDAADDDDANGHGHDHDDDDGDGSSGSASSSFQSAGSGDCEVVHYDDDGPADAAATAADDDRAPSAPTASMPSGEDSNQQSSSSFLYWHSLQQQQSSAEAASSSSDATVDATAAIISGDGRDVSHDGDDAAEDDVENPNNASGTPVDASFCAAHSLTVACGAADAVPASIVETDHTAGGGTFAACDGRQASGDAIHADASGDNQVRSAAGIVDVTAELCEDGASTAPPVQNISSAIDGSCSSSDIPNIVSPSVFAVAALASMTHFAQDLSSGEYECKTGAADNSGIGEGMAAARQSEGALAAVVRTEQDHEGDAARLLAVQRNANGTNVEVRSNIGGDAAVCSPASPPAPCLRIRASSSTLSSLGGDDEQADGGDGEVTGRLAGEENKPRTTDHEPEHHRRQQQQQPVSPEQRILGGSRQRSRSRSSSTSSGSSYEDISASGRHMSASQVLTSSVLSGHAGGAAGAPSSHHHQQYLQHDSLAGSFQLHASTTSSSAMMMGSSATSGYSYSNAAFSNAAAAVGDHRRNDSGNLQPPRQQRQLPSDIAVPTPRTTNPSTPLLSTIAAAGGQAVTAVTHHVASAMHAQLSSVGSAVSSTINTTLKGTVPTQIMKWLSTPKPTTPATPATIEGGAAAGAGGGGVRAAVGSAMAAGYSAGSATGGRLGMGTSWRSDTSAHSAGSGQSRGAPAAFTDTARSPGFAGGRPSAASPSLAAAGPALAAAGQSPLLHPAIQQLQGGIGGRPARSYAYPMPAPTPTPTAPAIPSTAHAPGAGIQVPVAAPGLSGRPRSSSGSSTTPSSLTPQQQQTQATPSASASVSYQHRQRQNSITLSGAIARYLDDTPELNPFSSIYVPAHGSDDEDEDVVVDDRAHDQMEYGGDESVFVDGDAHKRNANDGPPEIGPKPVSVVAPATTDGSDADVNENNFRTIRLSPPHAATAVLDASSAAATPTADFDVAALLGVDFGHTCGYKVPQAVPHRPQRPHSTTNSSAGSVLLHDSYHSGSAASEASCSLQVQTRPAGVVIDAASSSPLPLSTPQEAGAATATAAVHAGGLVAGFSAELSPGFALHLAREARTTAGQHSLAGDTGVGGSQGFCSDGAGPEGRLAERHHNARASTAEWTVLPLRMPAATTATRRKAVHYADVSDEDEGGDADAAPAASVSPWPQSTAPSLPPSTPYTPLYLRAEERRRRSNSGDSGTFRPSPRQQQHQPQTDGSGPASSYPLVPSQLPVHTRVSTPNVIGTPASGRTPIETPLPSRTSATTTPPLSSQHQRSYHPYGGHQRDRDAEAAALAEHARQCAREAVDAHARAEAAIRDAEGVKRDYEVKSGELLRATALWASAVRQREADVAGREARVKQAVVVLQSAKEALDRKAKDVNAAAEASGQRSSTGFASTSDNAAASDPGDVSRGDAGDENENDAAPRELSLLRSQVAGLMERNAHLRQQLCRRDAVIVRLAQKHAIAASHGGDDETMTTGAGGSEGLSVALSGDAIVQLQQEALRSRAARARLRNMARHAADGAAAGVMLGLARERQHGNAGSDSSDADNEMQQLGIGPFGPDSPRAQSYAADDSKNDEMEEDASKTLHRQRRRHRGPASLASSMSTAGGCSVISHRLSVDFGCSSVTTSSSASDDGDGGRSSSPLQTAPSISPSARRQKQDGSGRHHRRNHAAHRSLSRTAPGEKQRGDACRANRASSEPPSSTNEHPNASTATGRPVAADGEDHCAHSGDDASDKSTSDDFYVVGSGSCADAPCGRARSGSGDSSGSKQQQHRNTTGGAREHHTSEAQTQTTASDAATGWPSTVGTGLVAGDDQMGSASASVVGPLPTGTRQPRHQQHGRPPPVSALSKLLVDSCCQWDIVDVGGGSNDAPTTACDELALHALALREGTSDVQETSASAIGLAMAGDDAVARRSLTSADTIEHPGRQRMLSNSIGETTPPADASFSARASSHAAMEMTLLTAMRMVDAGMGIANVGADTPVVIPSLSTRRLGHSGQEQREAAAGSTTNSGAAAAASSCMSIRADLGGAAGASLPAHHHQHPPAAAAPGLSASTTASSYILAAASASVASPSSPAAATTPAVSYTTGCSDWTRVSVAACDADDVTGAGAAQAPHRERSHSAPVPLTTATDGARTAPMSWSDLHLGPAASASTTTAIAATAAGCNLWSSAHMPSVSRGDVSPLLPPSCHTGHHRHQQHRRSKTQGSSMSPLILPAPAPTCTASSGQGGEGRGHSMTPAIRSLAPQPAAGVGSTSTSHLPSYALSLLTAIAALPAISVRDHLPSQAAPMAAAPAGSGAGDDDVMHGGHRHRHMRGAAGAVQAFNHQSRRGEHTGPTRPGTPRPRSNQCAVAARPGDAFAPLPASDGGHSRAGEAGINLAMLVEAETSAATASMNSSVVLNSAVAAGSGTGAARQQQQCAPHPGVPARTSATSSTGVDRGKGSTRHEQTAHHPLKTTRPGLDLHRALLRNAMARAGTGSSSSLGNGSWHGEQVSVQLSSTSLSASHDGRGPMTASSSLPIGRNGGAKS